MIERIFDSSILLDYASLAILWVISISVGRRYINISKSNSAFYRLVHLLFFVGVFDIVKEYALKSSMVISEVPFLVAKLFYSISLCVLSLLTYQYTRSYVIKEDEKIKRSVLDMIAIIITIVAASISFVDMTCGILDKKELSDSNFLFNIYGLVLPLIVFIFNLFIVLKNKKDYSKSQRNAIVLFVLIVFCVTMLSHLIHFPYRIIVFAATVAVIIIQLSLETPDYNNLINAINEKEKQAKEADEARELAEKLRFEADQAKIQAEASYNEAKEARDQAYLSAQAAEEANRSAQKASKIKNEFLSRMSNEIRTPMNTIVGMTDMILSESREENTISYAADVSKAANNLLNIINNILDFSKIESGKVKLLEDEYDFKSMLKDIYNVYFIKAREKNIKLNFDIDENIPRYLVGDDVRIKQVLSNLLSNAVKFTDKGTVSLRVTLEGKGRASVLLKYMVKDTGCGMKEEDIIRIYESHGRGNDKNTDGINGSGLGISIISGLLTIMGSKLSVESIYGLGSQFSFSVRQTFSSKENVGDFYDTEERKAYSDDRELIFAPMAEVLVVDDNLMNIKVFEGIIKDTGIIVSTALSGMEALELTLNKKYDLIFMDHLMPEMNGIETMEHIRRNENNLNKDTKIIALVANSDKGAYDEYMGYGFDDVGFKPTTLNEINHLLWTHLPEDKYSSLPE